ncbi:GNAT family N-acetyltransferase [Oceanobacillus jeddahense]|uniref:GNAT family N-acetyltransferase n=1 Tax=Oceanobacillus jeddahense TaxID=1462527 RepID=A0ABY5JN54_9BACI|nr:GNAT family N-acetyltransferase [Oceanobacillus jeddahense]UUI01249.1 GNAT family N-acetyltransferase [Oceanobacillus jeddahense]
MSTYIKEVNKENWREIAALETAENQKDFMESIPFCLAESFIEALTTSLGLYAGDKPVGYAMVGFYFDEKKSIWFDRFMIDYRFQGKGYANQFIPLIEAYINGHYDVQIIRLSFVPGNDQAEQLYKKHGFVRTGEYDPEGEIIMEKHL